MADADKPAVPAKAKPTADLVGGAKVTEVEIAPVVPEGPEDGIEVITTAPGTFNANGIVKVGTKARVALDKFSAAWMKPATKEAAARLKKHLEADAED